MSHRMMTACLLLLAPQVAGNALAQNWSLDARKVGLGSPGGGEHVASRMIEEEREYRALVLPFGLIQVFRDFDRLNPSNDEFDLVRTLEYAAAPLHYTIGREAGDSRADDFIVDIANGELSRDLNDYRGFELVNQPMAAGLAAPNWGKTFRFRQRADGSFHGAYAGAGPYVSMRTAASIDEQLLGILNGAEAMYLRNAQMTTTNTSQGQLALAVTGGYRGRFAWPAGVGTGSTREGLYVAANYNYLHGFRYEDLDFRLRMDTDAAGLLTVNPALPPPLVVLRTSAESGRGFALDAGVGAVIGDWEFGVGANGLGNRLRWSDAEQTSYVHASLVSGEGDLSEGLTVPIGDVRVELPVDYRANVAYDVDRWAAVAEFGRGLQGASLHLGAEYRFPRIEMRGGAVYSRELWNPAGGVGINLRSRTWLDVAVYSNAANVARERKPALAVSLRFGR